MSKLNNARVLRGGVTSNYAIEEDFGINAVITNGVIRLYTEIPSKGGGKTGLVIELGDKAILRLLDEYISDGGIWAYRTLRDSIARSFDRLSDVAAREFSRGKTAAEREETLFENFLWSQNKTINHSTLLKRFRRVLDALEHSLESVSTMIPTSTKPRSR